MSSSNNNRLGFTLSPFKVALSVLVQDLCTPERVLASTRPSLSIFLLQQVRQADDYQEKSLRQLCQAISSFEATIGVTMDKQLVGTLQNIQSPDDLFDTLISLEALLQDGSAVDDEMPGLDSSSVLGIFVRKVLLAFHRTMFDGLSHLFTRMEEYVVAFDDPSHVPMISTQMPQAHNELSNFIQSHADEIEFMPSTLQVRTCNQNKIICCTQKKKLDVTLTGKIWADETQPGCCSAKHGRTSWRLILAVPLCSTTKRLPGKTRAQSCTHALICFGASRSLLTTPLLCVMHRLPWSIYTDISTMP
jgi:hypothetical protein